MKLRNLLFVVLAIAAFQSAVAAQDAFAVARDVRTKIAALMAAKDYEGALALYSQLEGGKYSLGDAAAQAGALRTHNVGTDKGKLFIAMQRPEEADKAYYTVFDARLASAEKALTDVAKYYGRGTPTGIDATLAKASLSMAKGDLSLANSVPVQRDAQYTLANLKARPFDPARLARLKALEQRMGGYTLP